MFDWPDISFDRAYIENQLKFYDELVENAFHRKRKKFYLLNSSRSENNSELAVQESSKKEETP